MDWQQAIALGIVATTAGTFLVTSLRKKRTPGCGCGCPAAAGSPKGPAITLRAKRGERPQVVVKLR